jgi:hypothetical protein
MAILSATQPWYSQPQGRDSGVDPRWRKPELQVQLREQVRWIDLSTKYIKELLKVDRLRSSLGLGCRLRAELRGD